MTISKVSFSILRDVLTRARVRASRRELSAYVSTALRQQQQHDRIVELLTEMEGESGPIPDDVMEEARQLWRDPVDGRG